MIANPQICYGWSRLTIKGACFGISLALHGIVLLAGSLGGGESKRIASKEIPQPLAIQTRLLLSQPADQSGIASRAEIAVSGEVRTNNLSGDTNITEPATPLAVTSPLISTASLSKPGNSEAHLDPGLGLVNEPEYVPRNQLSVVPVAQTSVDISYPPEVAGPGRYAGVFSIFIDELGEVRDVRMEDQRLPPAMERAVRQTFLQTRFSVGQRNGQDVKSHIRVEIVFDTI